MSVLKPVVSYLNKLTVGTYPICYQKTILPEDLTCSIENTLGKVSGGKKMYMKLVLAHFDHLESCVLWSTCAVLKELYCSKLMATITSQELRGRPAHFSHGSLASR